MSLTNSYYHATANVTLDCPSLQGSQTVDVAVVGGGLTGISSALALAKQGYRVALLEAKTLGYGASGRSGGQILPGFSADMNEIYRERGPIAGRDLWWLSVEAVNYVRNLVETHQIDCDLMDGALAAAITPKQEIKLVEDLNKLVDVFDFFDAQFIEQSELAHFVNSDRYRAGLFFPNAAHLHPLNFTLGLAQVAQNLGVKIYENSRAIEFDFGKPALIKTLQGELIAQYVVLGGNAYLPELAPLKSYVMPVSTFMIATAPLEMSQMAKCLPKKSAVYDLNFNLDYFRPSKDNRLLFGGVANYTAQESANTSTKLRKNLARAFPQISDLPVEFCWGGKVAITLNRTPHFGYLRPHVLFAQGYSGHGLALATLAGELIANAIRGSAEKFDLVAQFKHHPFPGGDYFRRPLLQLAVSYFRLRDRLGF